MLAAAFFFRKRLDAFLFDRYCFDAFLLVRYRCDAFWLVRNEPANDGVTATAAASTAARAIVVTALGLDSLLLSN